MKTTTTAPAQPVNLATLAPAIAAALSPAHPLRLPAGHTVGWTAKPAHEPAYPGATVGQWHLTRADGLKLWLAGSDGGWAAKGRIAISLSRPAAKDRQRVEVYRNAPGVWEKIIDPEITVAETGTAERIAADIARRLLPDAERVNALVLAKIGEEGRAADRRLAFLQSVAVAAGLPDYPRKYRSDDPSWDVGIYAPGSTPKDGERRLASVEIRHGDTAHVTIDTGPGQAEALIAFLRSPAYLNAATTIAHS